MSFIAKHYVQISGQMFTPGEVIGTPIPEDKIPRLLRHGAVVPLMKSTSPLENIAREKAGTDEEKELEALRADHASILCANGCAPDGNPLGETSTAQDKEAGDEEADATEEEVEADEEAPVPEIDVMDGIVAAEPEAPEEKQSATKPAKRQASKAAKTGKGRDKA